MNKDNLVILKASNELKLGSDTIYPNKYYRCLKDEEKGNARFYVDGINMSKDFFDEYFELAYDRIMRDWERIGLTKDGKLISKTAFKELASVHTYGKQTNNLRIMFFGFPKECMYGFYPIYSENKTKQLDGIYEWCKQVMDGNMNYFDTNHIQYGNKGIPLCYGALR